MPINKQQYEMLLRCSETKNISKWNEWRKKNPNEEIHLEGAVFFNAHLKGANFNDAHLKESQFGNAHLEGAYFHNAHLKGANLKNAHLNKTQFWSTHLEGVNFTSAKFEETNLSESFLQRADFQFANLINTSFQYAIVDGETLFCDINTDKKTNFTGVALDNARVEPKLKQLFEYNIRRLHWEEWYKQGKPTKWNEIKKYPAYCKPLVKLFWWVSDYGISTGRIVLTFFVTSVFFAAVYFSFYCYCCDGGIIANLGGTAEQPTPENYLFLRSIYFSIVTMTTLGFGDMYANPQSILGHILLMLQVLLGYALLGALITRFAVLFTSGGPAGKFTKDRTGKTDKDETK